MTVRTDPHLAVVGPVTARAQGDEECLAAGSPWGYLRLWLTCGQGFSPNRHARRHAAGSHAIVAPLDPAEGRRRCFVHGVVM